MVAIRSSWSVDQVYHHDLDGRLCTIPITWTSLIATDPAVEFGRGRSPFKLSDLLELLREPHSKTAEIKVDRTEEVKVDSSQLPADVEFKGHETVVVQDIVIKTNHVRFLKEKYYSASAGKTYLAALPAGYEEQFEPGVRSWVITLYYAGGMSEPKIGELLKQTGVSISVGQVSNLLTHNTQAWEAEARTMLHTGLQSTCWCQGLGHLYELGRNYKKTWREFLRLCP